MATTKIGSGALPSLANLQGKTVEELAFTLGRFGMEPDVRALNRATDRALEKFDALLDEGLRPDPETWQAIKKDVETQMGSYLRDQVRTAVRDYRLTKFKPAEPLTWIGLGNGMCPSCVKRHGKTKTLAQWKAQGLPGSSALLCQNKCRCGLHSNLVP